MTNEHYLLVSYVAAAGLGLGAAVGTAVILAGPHREATGVSPLLAFQRLVRGGLSGDAMAPWTLLGACVLLVECAVVLHVWAGSRPGVRMPVCLLCVSLSSVVYFLFVSGFVFPAAYGLWVSVLACGLMAAGSLGEVLAAPSAGDGPAQPVAARADRKAVLLACLTVVLAMGGCSSYVTFEGCDAEPLCRLLEKAVDVGFHREVAVEPNRPLNLSRKGTLFSRGYRLSCGVETSGPHTTARLAVTESDFLLPCIGWRSQGEEKMLLGLVTEALLRQTGAEVVEASDPFYRRLRPIAGGQRYDVSSVVLYGVTQEEVIFSLRDPNALAFIGPGLGRGAHRGKGLCPITVTYVECAIILPDRHTFDVDTRQTPEGVRISVSGTCEVGGFFFRRQGTLGRTLLNRSLRSIVIYLLDRLPHASLAEPGHPAGSCACESAPHSTSP